MQDEILVNGKKMYAVKVGETKFECFTGIKDGVLTEYDEDGMKLYILLNKPTIEEMESVSSKGSFEISFSYIEGCGILQYKFGSMPWCDCVFEPRLYKKANFPDLIKEKGKGLGLYVFLIDPSAGGLVKGLRVIGLGREFSMKLIEWCTRTQGMPFYKDRHNQKVDSIMENYDTKDILKQSLFRWKIGNKGDGNERKPIDRETI